MSIPRKSQNPRKNVLYRTIHGINPYFDINFQVSKFSNIPKYPNAELRNQQKFLGLEKFYFPFLKS